MKRHIFFNFHEGQQQQKKQSNTKLNTETQKKHKEQVNEQMCVSFIQRTLKLLKDNFSSLTTTTKKTLISKWADGYSRTGVVIGSIELE